MPIDSPVLVSSPSPGAVRTEQIDRVLDAALACFGRWGLAKTTLDDVAREAGLSRATVYRAVPGGKSELVREVVQREIVHVAEGLEATLAAAESLEDLLVSGLVGLAQRVAEHEMMQYLLAHEPDVVLPYIAFDRMEPALELGVALAGPHLARFLDADVAAEVAEWMTRLFVSFTFVPGSVDLTDAGDVERYLRSFVLPGVALAAGRDTEPILHSAKLPTTSISRGNDD